VKLVYIPFGEFFFLFFLEEDFFEKRLDVFFVVFFLDVVILEIYFVFKLDSN
jgi:hypothetical protein